MPHFLDPEQWGKGVKFQILDKTTGEWRDAEEGEIITQGSVPKPIWHMDILKERWGKDEKSKKIWKEIMG